MNTDSIIQQLDVFRNRLFVKQGNGVVPAPPGVISTNLLLIRGLLIELVDKVYEAELEYRRAKAARFDRLLKDGVKKSPALDSLKMEPDLIELEASVERLRAYMKYTDGLCTSAQSVLRVQTGSEKNQY